MEREACVCDHGYERSDLCAEIIIIIVYSICTAYLSCREISLSMPKCNLVLITPYVCNVKLSPGGRSKSLGRR